MRAELKDYAVNLVSQARDSRIDLRIIGSIGVALATGVNLLSRPVAPKDIDLIAKRTSRKEVQDFMSKNRWELMTDLLLLSELRESYCSTDHHFSLDLYYDQIDGNHCISLRDRLHLSFPTPPTVDLLLTKLQRVQLRQQDMWDACALLRVYYTPEEVSYFGVQLGQSWGLYTTATDNLRLLASNCSEQASVRRFLEEAARGRKSLRWQLRSLVGRRWKWWRDIYDMEIPA